MSQLSMDMILYLYIGICLTGVARVSLWILDALHPRKTCLAKSLAEQIVEQIFRLYVVAVYIGVAMILPTFWDGGYHLHNVPQQFVEDLWQESGCLFVANFLVGCYWFFSLVSMRSLVGIKKEILPTKGF